MFGVKEIDSALLEEWLSGESDEEIKLIDVRTPMEVAQGAIPGHEHIPLHMLPHQMDAIRSHKKVVLYCRSGVRSAQACAFFNQYGIDNVYNLRGGIIAWANEGRKVA